VLQYNQDWDENYFPTVTEREAPDPTAITNPSGLSNAAYYLQFSWRGRLASYVPVSTGLVVAGNTSTSGIAQDPDGVPVVLTAANISNKVSAGGYYWPVDYGFNLNEGYVTNAPAGSVPYQA
jgi:hypothetical protein